MTINTLDLNAPIWFLHKSTLNVTQVNGISITCDHQITSIQYKTKAGFQFLAENENISWWSSKENLLNHISKMEPTPAPNPAPSSFDDALEQLFSDSPTPKPKPTPVNAALHDVINSIFQLSSNAPNKCKCGGKCSH